MPSHPSAMLVARVRAFAARHGLWSPASTAVVALSGGGDSVALLLVLRELAGHGELRLAGVVHVHHHLRGDEADRDEAFAAALAGRLDLPYLVQHRDVAAEAIRTGASTTMAARTMRREALIDAAERLGADRIATAHTLDDRAETVLMRVIRGTGVAGLSGIDPVRGRFIRPLLGETRADLRAWLAAAGEAWCEDTTNASVEAPRGRVRHELLPWLAQRFNPSVSRALARLADVAGEEDAYLRGGAEAAFASVRRDHPDGVGLDAADLAGLPSAVARRVARLALETLHPARAYDLEEVDAVRRAAEAADGSPRDLSGVRVERIGAAVVLVQREGLPSPPPGPYRYDLAVPGVVECAPSGFRLEAVGPIRAESQPKAGKLDEAVVSAEAWRGPLVVRSRRPGDRVRLPGVGGRTKVQDLFVNRKISRRDRDRTPIVTDSEGRIVWVGGVAVGEEFRVHPRTNAVVVLKLRWL